jgi:hypothetical protein
MKCMGSEALWGKANKALLPPWEWNLPIDSASDAWKEGSGALLPAVACRGSSA